MDSTESVHDQATNAVNRARKAAAEAGARFVASSPNLRIRTASGDIYRALLVTTCEPGSVMMTAMKESGLATKDDVVDSMVVDAVGVHSTSTALVEVAARAAADYLSRELGQTFYVSIRRLVN
jgi:hypothetical protein